MTPPPPALRVDVAWTLRTDWRARPLLRRVARHAARAEGFRTGHLSIAVVGACAMTTLHDRYMNIAEPTDVLTFDLDTDPARGHLEAEIVVCADVARRAARHRVKQSHRATDRPHGSRPRPTPLAAARAELALYVVHGLLHLAGYDDHAPADFKRMHAREDELLTDLGMGPVFHSLPLNGGAGGG